MQNLHIKLKISDREYSLRIDPKEEQILRKAGKILNDQLREKREKLGIRDKQDLMAMVAFDGIVQQLRNHTSSQQMSEQLLSMEQKIAAALS